MTGRTARQRSGTVWATALLGVVLGASCKAGPATEELARTLQAQLDRGFGKGVLEVKALRRRGHTPSQDSAGKALTLVYYDARLRFGASRGVKNWSAKVGSLISVLGATPRGVTGIKPSGNQRGDEVVVHGVLAFHKVGERWRKATFIPRASKGQAAEQLPYRQELDKLTRLGKALGRAPRGSGELERLTADLSRLVATYKRRLGRARGTLSLASGPRSGSYYRMGSALAGTITRAGTRARAFDTAGSAENCRLLQAGEVDLAFVQSDIAALAFSGRGPFAAKPHGRLRALAALYPEALQIITRARDGVSRIGDLRGKRVDIGALGSGAHENALQVLAAVGLTRRDFASVSESGPTLAGAALVAHKIDALFVTSAFPHPMLRDLSQRVPIDLVGLDESSIAVARHRHPFLVPLTVPETTYPGMKTERRTVGVTALLVGRDDLPAERVRMVLQQLYRNVDELSRRSAQGYFIALGSAKNGVSIPWHPSARLWLDDQQHVRP